MLSVNDYKRLAQEYLAGNQLEFPDQSGFTHRYEGKVQPKERPRFAKKTGSTFTPAATRTFEKSVKVWARREGMVPVTYPIRVRIIIYEKTDDAQQIALGCHGLTFPKRGDIDNMAKGILDALNKIAYTDDHLVNHLTVTRRWAAKYGFSLHMERCGLSAFEYENFLKFLKAATING